MISSVATDDSCYRLVIVHKKDNDYPEQTHTMYMDTFIEAKIYLDAVYHIFGIIQSVKIECYEK